MANPKGAGRKGFYDEQMVKKIIDLSNKTIYETLKGEGRFSDLKNEIIVDIAKHFSLKGIPQHITSDGSLAPKTIVLVRNEKAVLETERIIDETKLVSD